MPNNISSTMSNNSNYHNDKRVFIKISFDLEQD